MKWIAFQCFVRMKLHINYYLHISIIKRVPGAGLDSIFHSIFICNYVDLSFSSVEFHSEWLITNYVFESEHLNTEEEKKNNNTESKRQHNMNLTLNPFYCFGFSIRKHQFRMYSMHPSFVLPFVMIMYVMLFSCSKYVDRWIRRFVDPCIVNVLCMRRAH